MESSSSTVPSAREEVIDRFLDNVDVWKTIFEMLEVKDRIRLEMTNKRLHILMFEYWKRVTSFDSKNYLTEMRENPSMNKKRCAAFVSICVNRIGDGLRSLTIREHYPATLCSAHLSSIGEGCPNIETINFLFENTEEYDIGALYIRFDSFSRLKTLTVSSAEIDFAYASASIFLSIPTSIEVIRGLWGDEEDEHFENGAQIESFFADRPSLREIWLKGLYTRDESKADIFRVIAERCPHLKSINLSSSNYIDYRGIVALESMKELRISDEYMDEMEIVTICERSPLVEALEFRFRFSSNLDLQSEALNALGSLTKLRELIFTDPLCWTMADVNAQSLMTEFACELARNSGPSLRRLVLDYKMPVSTAAIDALANGCPKLRHVEFGVRVGEVEPASIRFLIDCIVAHPSWITQTGEPALAIYSHVMHDDEDEVEAGRAVFEALAAPAANLPAGVKLIIY